jgi:hypothetical protein
MRKLIMFGLLALSGCAALGRHESAVLPAAAAVPHTFVGWAAINGGGARARATNDDWHLQNDVHLSVGGGRVPLHWRDGALSGYSLELVRASYPERQLVVLQLNVIEDANGKSLTYVWADEKTDAIGLNLGWLQVGMQLEAFRPQAK